MSQLVVNEIKIERPTIPPRYFGDIPEAEVFEGTFRGLYGIWLKPKNPNSKDSNDLIHLRCLTVFNNVSDHELITNYIPRDAELFIRP